MPKFGVVPLPKRAMMWHPESLVTVGNALVRTNSTGQGFDMLAYQNTSADGDTFTQGFWLRAGTYTFVVWGATNPNRGIVDWYIDDVIVVSQQDWYSAGNVLNVRKTASVVVSRDGWHVLKGVINGKHASASAHVMSLTYMALLPSAD